jgi:hypothetical protein
VTGPCGQSDGEKRATGGFGDASGESVVARRIELEAVQHLPGPGKSWTPEPTEQRLRAVSDEQSFIVRRRIKRPASLLSIRVIPTATANSFCALYMSIQSFH